MIRADSRNKMTNVPGTVDFMPPECFAANPVYGTPMDVFSFAGIILHIFNQQWPTPSQQVQFNPQTRKRVALSEVERRQQYLDKMSGEGEVLRPLVEECLDDDPAVRPTIATICKKIQGNSLKAPSNYIILLQNIEQLHSKVEEQTSMILELQATIKQTEKQVPVKYFKTTALKETLTQGGQQINTLRRNLISTVSYQLKYNNTPNLHKIPFRMHLP